MITKRLCTLALSLLLLSFCLLLPAAAANESSPLAPSSILSLQDGSLICTDVYNKAVWLLKPDQSRTRLAGRQGVADAYGVPTGGYLDGKASESAFQTPWSISPYQKGYAVSDTENHVLRYIEGSKVTTLAGSGKAGLNNASGTKARFNRPTGLITLEDGSLLVADTENHLLRRVDSKGVVTTYAGSGEGCADGDALSAQFREPTGLALSGDVLYVADSGNNRICKLENGIVTTLAGSRDGEEGFVNGKAENARFSSPQGLATDGTSVYVADTGNGALRRIQNGRVFTPAPWKRTPSLAEPRAMALQSDTLYVGDVFTQQLFSLPLTATQNTYADVQKRDWFYDAVQKSLCLGLLNAEARTHFDPENTVRRAEAILLLSRLEEALYPASVIGGEAAFVDVPNEALHAAAASWAKAYGLAQGDGLNLLSAPPITRADWVTLLYRHAKSSGLFVTTATVPTVAVDDLPSYAADSYAWACAVGLFDGQQTNAPAPLQSLTRAELIDTAMRYLWLF